MKKLVSIDPITGRAVRGIDVLGTDAHPRPRDEPPALGRRCDPWFLGAASRRYRGTFAREARRTRLAAPKIRTSRTLWRQRRPGSSHGPSAAPSSTRPAVRSGPSPPRCSSRRPPTDPIRTSWRLRRESRRLRGRGNGDARQALRGVRGVVRRGGCAGTRAIQVASVRVLPRGSRRSRAFKDSGGWIAFTGARLAGDLARPDAPGPAGAYRAGRGAAHPGTAQHDQLSRLLEPPIPTRPRRRRLAMPRLRAVGMSELILSLIPADDWFWSDSAEAVREARRAGQSNARYYHHRLASFALVRITDDLGNGPRRGAPSWVSAGSDDETVALDSARTPTNSTVCRWPLPGSRDSRQGERCRMNAARGSEVRGGSCVSLYTTRLAESYASTP